MPIKSPVVSEIGTKTYHINEFGLASMYLVVGKKRALLIDAGVGICDLKALIRRITSLPYDVVLTHGHVGHAGGMKQFKNVYLHPEDQAEALAITKETREAFAGYSRKGRDGDLWNFKSGMFVQSEEAPLVQELYEGLEFDLGGRCIKVIYTPGHTMGSCSFIDDASRIIFTGDACEKHQFIKSCTVSMMVRGLFNIRRHIKEFDQIYGGHVNYETVAVTRSARSKVLLDNITACRCILEKSVTPVSLVEQSGREWAAVEIGTVLIAYDPECLWEAEENLAPIPIGM